MGNKTKICCFDVQQDIVDYLRDEFDVYDGSYGVNVNIQNEIKEELFLYFVLNVDIDAIASSIDIKLIP